MATEVMGIEKAEVVAIQRSLTSLSERANAITVRTADEYAACCQIVLDGRAYIKDVGFKLDPGIESAKQHLEFLRNEKAKYVNPAKQIVDIAEKKAEGWKAEERRKAALEQARINEERRREAERVAEQERRAAIAQADAERKRREKEIEEQRKAGELKKREAERLRREAEAEAEAAKKQAEEAARIAATEVKQVKVEPAVPKVAGIKARVNWKFRIVNAALIPRSYLKPDEVKIGEDVRRMKDKPKAEAAIPGIEVYSEDGI